jgi:hypothetical protein
MNEIIAPLVEADPSCAQSIAEGALMRLACGARCFDRYSQALLGDPLDSLACWPLPVAITAAGLAC